MRLEAGCPQCPALPTRAGEQWTCELHGPITPLWRARKPDYASFAEHLQRSRPLPTWLPWPMPPGWRVTDFGSVGAAGSGGQAVFATCTGPTELDGVVEITVVTEEPGVNLGARCAQVAHADPGPEAVVGAPVVKIRVGLVSVRLWTVPTEEHAPMDESLGKRDVLDRSVLIGEADGRWLWVVLRPASAALLLHSGLALQDVSGLGPELVTMPFGEVPRGGW